MKKLVVYFVAVVILFSFAACGPTADDDGIIIDPNKTQINFTVYEGGHGTLWAKELAKQFMAANPQYDSEYQIIIRGEKRGDADVVVEINSGKSPYQGYILSSNNIVSAIYRDSILELSDVVDRKVDGEENDTIRNKILRYDEWSSIYSKYGEGLYAVPFADSVMGWVYDHQYFVDEGFYITASASDEAGMTAQGITFEIVERGNSTEYKFVSSTGAVNYREGDTILSAGKDGKYGTYDDGQPQTIAEWDDLIANISGTNAKSFIWGGAVDSYTRTILEALFAQYGGMDIYNTYFTYDSGGEEVELADGTKTVITPNNGYLVNQIAEVKYAYEFFYKYFNAHKDSLSYDTIHSSATDLTSYHKDAQNKFLLGHKGAKDNPRSAMLLDGTWWEYEASTMFNTIAATEPERGYGMREYRYMLLPNLGENQKSDKSVISACESGVMLLTKDSNTNRQAVTKDFLAYILKDESLRYFVRETNSLMPYEIGLTEEDINSITPFARNMIELYFDHDNVDVVRPQISSLVSPLAYTSPRGTDRLAPKISDKFMTSPGTLARTYTLTQTLSGLKSSYTAADWANYIALAKNQGFYTNL